MPCVMMAPRTISANSFCCTVQCVNWLVPACRNRSDSSAVMYCGVGVTLSTCAEKVMIRGTSVYE
jgi:hypothetical protein